MAKIPLEESWKKLLIGEFDKPYFQQIKNILLTEKQGGKTIYPRSNQIFSAFENTPIHNIKVVIIGQDPYHGVGQANGLCFSVSNGIAPPPSLVNIYKEIESDLGIAINRNNGNLSSWAKQGVFLLNSILSVKANEPASHSQIGWQTFTDKVIETISTTNENVVFMLWGKFAQSKELLIDKKKHLVLKAAHPSPFSAYNGFMGCKHFSQANTYLAINRPPAIDWHI
ncbi:MAG: uracil-DNA glycosylase [Bacteroidota bacterium]|nr:uracil-DNA glycosylase [Bacteroidota bacterium]